MKKILNLDIKYIIAFIFSIVLSGAGGALINGSSDVDALRKGINIVIQDVMKPKIEELEKAIALNTEFRISEYIKLITKNAKKILSDPTDVKKSDILLCISYLNKIPDEIKNEALQADIAIIIAWNLNNS